MVERVHVLYDDMLAKAMEIVESAIGRDAKFTRLYIDCRAIRARASALGERSVAAELTEFSERASVVLEVSKDEAERKSSVRAMMDGPAIEAGEHDSGGAITCSSDWAAVTPLGSPAAHSVALVRPG